MLVLTGCGNDASSQRSKAMAKETFGFLKSVVSKPKESEVPPKAPPDPEALVTNALAVIEDAPLMFVAREKTGAYGVASIYGQNGAVTTWVTRELISLSLDRGMLTATRGLGNDLMSVEDGGASALISARRAGSVEKTYRFLDGLDRPNRLILSCDIVPGETQPVESGEISVKAQMVSEVCRKGDFKIANAYWIDTDGRMVQSVQWAGAVNGQMVFRRLRW